MNLCFCGCCLIKRSSYGHCKLEILRSEDVCSELCNTQSVHQNYGTLKNFFSFTNIHICIPLLAKGKAKTIGDGYLGEFMVETETSEILLRSGMHFQTEK